jgi:mannobiose 2-epimerase
MILSIIKEKLPAEMSLELERILGFWSTRAIDTQWGGFVGQIDHFGNVNHGSSKGAVLNARILWTFSAAYRVIGSETFNKMADRAYGYLIETFWDKEYGGLIWEADAAGHPLSSRKQAYAQGFGIYALSEYFLATGNKDSLEYAKKLYHLLEDKFLDTKQGGYIEALDKKWDALADMRLSEKDANLPKSMNTHLHILEPYTNLYRAWPQEKLKQSILHLLDVFQHKIIDHTSGHFRLFFEMDWSCRSSIVSYGHEMEGAWLLHEAAKETGDEKRIRDIQKSALRLVDITLKEGSDADGSIYYEKEGDHLDTDKHWWPQAEAMVGFMDAWEMDQKDAYLEQVARIWSFIKEHLIDHQNGEWYWCVDKRGRPDPSQDKAGFWKCPYHNSRALMEVINRIQKLSKREVGYGFIL